jgi:hypothetical protein
MRLEVGENKEGLASLIREVEVRHRPIFTEPKDYLLTDSIRSVYERTYKIAYSEAITHFGFRRNGNGQRAPGPLYS